MLRTDRDGAWKEFFRKFLPAIFALTFPKIEKLIDWNAGIVFLDKELQEMFHDSGGKRTVDILIQATLIGGGKLKVLFHFEVQHGKDPKTAERVFRYYARLAEMHGPNVVSLVILADQDKTWHPIKYEHELLGCKVLFEFPTCKLTDLTKDLDALFASPIPAALVIVADWVSQTQKDPKARLEWKLKIIQSLYDKGLNKEEVLAIFDLADRLVPLEAEEKQIFRQEVLNLEKEKNMPYINSIQEMSLEEGMEKGMAKGIKKGKQIGRQEGRQEGREEGMAKAMRIAIMETVEIRFKVSERGIAAAIKGKTNLDELKALFKLALSAKDFASFKRQAALR